MSGTTTAPPSAPLRIDHLSKHFGRRRRGRVTALDKAETGTTVPSIPPTGAVAVIGSVAVLTTATIMASLRAMPGRRG